MTERMDPGHVNEPPPGSRPPGGMPLWVKVSLIVVAALIGLFVILNLLGKGGQHGPQRHMGPTNHGAPASVGR